jgi:trigger factor
MSVKSVNATEIKNQVKLELHIDKDVFEAAVKKVYQKNAKNITIPGFRKGKAPRSIIEKMYGKGVFYEDALNDILPAELEKAIEEAKLSVVSRPELDVEEIGDDGVTVSALYYIKPEVELKAYKGLEAVKTVAPVTDEDVDHEISHALERAARMVEVDRACENGDFATIDYMGSVDGVPFDGGKAEGHKLEIGSNSFIPGFEEQIIGHKAGEAFDITVKFPEEYHAEDLKGKEAVFAIVLHKLEKKELPALDDEFVKDVSEFDTLDEYKADIKANIEKRNERMAEEAFEAALSDALIANLEADIPESMFELEVERMIDDYAYRMQSQGISLDMYMKYTGMTIDSFKEQFKPQAESRVKFQLALEKIVALENITVSDEDIDAEYAKMAEAYKMEVEQVKKAVPDTAIREDLIRSRAFDLVKENAKAKKAAAKKTAAKKAEDETAEKKPAAKKTTAKKAEGETAEKKPAAKKTTAKKAEGETAEKKPAAKKTTTAKKTEK